MLASIILVTVLYLVNVEQFIGIERCRLRLFGKHGIRYGAVPKSNNESAVTEKSETTDKTRFSLVARAQIYDQDAWNELVALYAPLIGRWCHRFGLQPASIADISQEVFISVTKGIATFRPKEETGSFRAWLWQITRNKIVDRQRSAAQRSFATGESDAFAKLQQVVDIQELPIDDPSDGDAINSLVARAIEQVRVEFQPATWTAFWRAAIDGISTEVVANELQMTNAAVRQARSRVSRRLRQQL